MQKEILKCPDCGKAVEEREVKKHILQCVKNQKKFLNHTLQIAQYMNPQYLQFFRGQLDLASQHIQKMLGKDNKQYKVSEKEKPPIKNGHTSPDHNNQTNYTNVKLQYVQSQLEDQFSRIKKYHDDLMECTHCKRKINTDDFTDFIYADICLHLLCMGCVKSYIEGEYINMAGFLLCLHKECKQAIPEYQIKAIIGDDQFSRLSTKLNQKAMGGLTVCCKCKQGFQFLAGNPKDAPKQDQKGQPIPPTKCQHFAKNRFMCPNTLCKQQQCKGCGATPYHLGLDCQQYNTKKNAKKCRYCDEMLQLGYTSAIGIRAFDDICDGKECREKVSKACAKMRACKHPCCGYIGEKQCLPCLDDSCAKKNDSLHGQNAESFCSICYIEGLSAMPCVQSKCGHIYHYACLEKRLEVRWITPRIFLNFCNCPICKKWIQLPPDCPLSKKINKYQQLHKNIQTKSLQRLKYEGHDKDDRLHDSKSEYKDNPEAYAMAIYAYFQCYKCKQPYFGGRKSCAQAMNDRDNSTQFDPKQLVCPKCCPISIQNCPKHGKEFIQFKCKFCCSVAMWFCWGNTHFCDQCHKKQCSGIYISKLPKDKLPICEGPGKCPSGGEHGENGEELSIGCALCRDFKASDKDF